MNILHRTSRTLTAAAVGLLVALGACADEPGADVDVDAGVVDGAEALSPADLGALGGRIYAAPDEAPELLEQRGMTPEDFRHRIQEISTDPVAWRAYTDAFRAEAGDTAGPADPATADEGTGPGG